MGTVYFSGVERPGFGVDHSPPYRAEVKKRVELYFYSHFGPSWPVLLWIIYIYIYIYIICLSLYLLWHFGPYSVHGLPYRCFTTSDQPDSETSSWQHTSLTRDRYPGPRRDSNPQSSKWAPQTHALDWATEYVVNQILTTSISRYLKLKQEPNIVQIFITSACGGQRMLLVLT